jgi:serine/threonine protein kinase
VLGSYAESNPEHSRALRERIEALARVGLLDREASTKDEVPDRIGDFDLERRLGGGGMGVVYLARQRSMQRRVALKLVRPGHFFYEGTRARFRREAESAARLSHPNIVTVHTFGEENGVPYLAMEYVRGASLDRVVRALARRDAKGLRGRDFLAAVLECQPPDDGESVHADETFFAGSTADVVLRITLALARALAHAHERGVLQRDVKPSNVMLTADGRVLLLDFGLSSLTGADRVTRSGAMVGSLPTMAPEQVRGDAVDVRTDVYGLGVTMYELLTRRPPYLESGNPERTRAKILDGRPMPPRRVDASIPRDVETVCLVAMDADAARRYDSAESFAADLQNVIAQRPIHARPAGLWTHFERWARRRPGAAVALVLAAVLVVGGPAVLAWQSSTARVRLQQEVVRADTHRDEALVALARADENYRQARVALQRADRNFDRMLRVLDLVTRVARDDLADVPMAEEGRRGVLRGVAAFFQELAQEPGAGPELDFERAVALTWLGRAQEGLDEFEAARASLREAEALFRRHEVVAGSPRAKDLARVLWYLARVEDREGHGAAALAHFESALQLFPDGALDAVPTALDRARIESEMVHVWRQSGETGRARAALTALIGKLEGYSFEHNPQIAELAAWCYGESTVLDTRMERGAERRDGIERALVIHETLAARDPEARVPRQKLMIALSNMGGLLTETREFAAAIEHLERAQGIAEGLVEDFPGIPLYRFNLAGVLVNSSAARLQVRGDAQGQQKARARQELERATQIMRRLLEDDPAEVDYRSHYLSAATNLVAVQVTDNEYAAALEGLDRLDPELEELARVRPGDRHVAQGRAVNAINRVRANLALGRVPAACDAGRAACALGDPFAIATAANILGLVIEHDRETPERKAMARDTMLHMIAAAIDAGLETEALEDFPRLVELQDDPRLQAIRGR